MVPVYSLVAMTLNGSLVSKLCQNIQIHPGGNPLWAAQESNELLGKCLDTVFAFVRPACH